MKADTSAESIPPGRLDGELFSRRDGPFRVALVYRNFNLAGSLERSTVLLARALAALGVDVHCYCNPETRWVEAPEVTFHDIRPSVTSRTRSRYPIECSSFAIAATAALRRDRGAYDIVDVSGTSAWEHDVVTVHGVTKADQWRWAREAAGRYRAPRLRALLAPVTRPQVAVARTIERLQFRPARFRRLIAATPTVKDDLERVHGVPPSLIDIVPYPVDVPMFSAPPGRDHAFRQSLGIGTEDTMLLFVGNAFERKGLDVAIEALAGLSPETHLVVVGDDETTAPFFAEARALGVADRVHFAGGSGESYRYYRAADVFVLPTRQDPWGITLIEAMAAGLPIVTSAAAGAAGVVAAAGAGIVLESPTGASLRRSLAALLTDHDLRAAMAEAGPPAAARFDLGHQALMTLDVYRRARAPRPARA